MAGEPWRLHPRPRRGPCPAPDHGRDTAARTDMTAVEQMMSAASQHGRVLHPVKAISTRLHAWRGWAGAALDLVTVQTGALLRVQR